MLTYKDPNHVHLQLYPHVFIPILTSVFYINARYLCLALYALFLFNIVIYVQNKYTYTFILWLNPANPTKQTNAPQLKHKGRVDNDYTYIKSRQGILCRIKYTQP